MKTKFEYKARIESCQTEAEFKKALADWRNEMQSASILEGKWLWEVKDFAFLYADQENWLRDSIKGSHGERALRYYDEFISFAYQLKALLSFSPIPLAVHRLVIKTLCETGKTAEYVASLQSVCKSFNVDLQGIAADLDCFCSMADIAGADWVGDFWRAAADLSDCLEKSEFTEYIIGFGANRDELGFCDFVLRAGILNQWQIQWIQEYKARREWEIEVFEENWAAANLEAGGADSPGLTVSRESGRPDTSTDEPQERQIPAELNTPKAKEYFAKAIAAGLMDKSFTWIASNAALALFCLGMTEALDLPVQKTGFIRWQPFEALFGKNQNTLRAAIRDIRSADANTPPQYDKLKEMFPNTDFDKYCKGEY